MTINRPFHHILSGEHAFYKESNYIETTRQEGAQSKPVAVTYTWNTESKVWRVVKDIFSVLVFPILIYKALHAFAGSFIVPASFTANLNEIDRIRANILNNDSTWKYKRITVEVDGYHIDGMIFGKESTLDNGRWLLVSNGNNQVYEYTLPNHNSSITDIITRINSNALVFNYPGVGRSPGFPNSTAAGYPNRETMAKAYKAMLNFLEDKNKGIGADQIIGYGNSIGGGVQGDALRSHPLKDGIKYVFIKNRTFSNLSATVSLLTHKFLGFLVKILGWNIDSVESSKKLKAKEIILQTADVSRYRELGTTPGIQDSAFIAESDGIIFKEASLAKALLDDPSCPKTNKCFIGIPDGHNDRLSEVNYLTNKIEAMLA